MITDKVNELKAMAMIPGKSHQKGATEMKKGKENKKKRQLR